MKLKIHFKNLYKSEMARSAVLAQLGQIIEKFPQLQADHLHIVLSMDNSPVQPGPDLFRVKVRVTGGRYAGVIMEKTAPNLYVALADLTDHFQERLNRFGDKQRVRRRGNARRLATQKFQINR